MREGRLLLLPLAALVALASACAPSGSGLLGAEEAAARVPPLVSAPEQEGDAETTRTSATPSAVLTAEPPPSPDEAAGLRSRDVVERGTGAMLVVPGSSPAPGTGRERRVRVEVEGGLDVDGAAFAAFVMETLNDQRSWTRDGYTFSRTDGDAEVVVVLASPRTSAAMCAPLVTNGTLSCRQGPRAILTVYRWVNGTQDYGDDLTGYRRYLVNHEVGHVLGHGHESCPGAGAIAPVMQQQTKGVSPCVPNSWPYP